MKQTFPTILRGKVVSGLGEGRFFTGLSWVKDQLVEKLGIDPYPGTLNLKLDSREVLREWEKLKNLAGIAIVAPLKENSCNGRCFKILIQQKLPGAIVFPEVPGYPMDKLEIIAAWNLKEVLGIEDGEEIRIDVIGADCSP